MALAVNEGRKAVPKCGDNPPVGCILVQDGAVVAQGHTNSPGKPHAEARVLPRLHGQLKMTSWTYPATVDTPRLLLEALPDIES